MTSNILSFVSRVIPAQAKTLRELLNAIARPNDARYIPFAKLAQVHFSSFVVFESEAYEPYLVFENNFDGELAAYLAVLCSAAAPVLHEIYSCCMDYGVVWSEDHTGIVNYLMDHIVMPNALYIGTIGRLVGQIQNEAVLRERIEVHLDQISNRDEDLTPERIRQTVESAIRADPGLAWAGTPPPQRTLWERIAPWVKIVLVGLAALILLPLLVPVAIVWIIVLVWHEHHDVSMAGSPDDDFLNKLLAKETNPRRVQNHLASITLVKPGWSRRTTLRIVLLLVGMLARTATKGQLSGIPSIHFAHWSILDGDRLLFLTNYDGSWENYLDDFIDKAHKGLTAIWSNTIGFPPTRFLIIGGASDGERFKAFSRVSQNPTNFWYPAYEKLTVQNININSAIRAGLFQSFDRAQTMAWLRLF